MTEEQMRALMAWIDARIAVSAVRHSAGPGLADVRSLAIQRHRDLERAMQFQEGSLDD